MAKNNQLPEADHDYAFLSDRFIRHANLPMHMGEFPGADGKAKGVGSCGDVIEVYLSINDQQITDIKYVPHGCIYTVACGSAMSLLVNGKSLEKALKITPEDVAKELDGLPEDHMHCASLAVNTLGEAIDDFYQKEWGNKKTGAGGISLKAS